MKKFILMIGILWSGVAFSQDYIFEHISSNNGLSNNLVRDIIQDKQGYLWFATLGGLNRYDGHIFDIYKTVMGDTLSLSDSRLNVIFQDNNGFIWARSSLGNLHRIDPVKHQVINCLEQGILPAGTNVLNFYISQNGDLWLLLNKGLLRIYYESDESKIFRACYFDSQNGLPGNAVNFVHDDSNGNIWIGTAKGLVRLSITNEKQKPVFDYFHNVPDVPFLSVSELDNYLYFGTGERKMMVFDKKSGKLSEQTEISQKLQGNIISMAINSRQEMLLGTSVGDVVFYDPYTHQFDYYKKNEDINLNTSTVPEIFTDSYGIFWLITEKRGLFQFDPGTKKFRYFDLNSKNRSFLGELDKQILLEDSNRDLWVGINGGGLFLYNRSLKKFKQFKHNPDNTESLSSDIVLSLYEDRSKNLWIGTSYGGVNKISLKKEQIRKVTPVKKPQTDFDNYIRSVTADVLGNIWVGTKAGKIYAYRGTRKIGTIPDDLYDSKIFPITNAYCLFFDNDHNLWIGSKGNGIYVIKSLLGYISNLQNKNIRIVHFRNEPGEENSLSSDNVYSIKQDIYGQYWIGMLNGGLNLLTDPFDQPVFQHFTVQGKNSDGIVSKEVRDLFFDCDQNLWIATSEGISILENKYLKATRKQFINLAPSIKNSLGMSGKVVYQIRQAKNKDILLATLDGGINCLKAEDFKHRNFRWIHQKSEILSPNVYSLEEDNNKNIWMGTDNGLYRLDMVNDVIEKHQIKNNFLPLTFSEGCSQVTQKHEIVFGSNDGFIIFHPDSIQKDTTQFPLRFSRLEVNGEQITNQKSDILQSTIEGQKEIRLSYLQNNITLYFSILDFEAPDAIQYSYFLEGYDSYWSNPSTSNSATYRKLPPGDYVLQVKGTNSSGSWMKTPSKLSIHIRPPFWKSTIGYILIILIVSLAITISSFVLYRQLIIQNKIRLEKEITEKRMEYYTNISHEFKTPLSLILSPAEEIIMSHKSTDFAREKGLQIKKNAAYLKRLIEQILDFRKIREGKMQLKVSELNLIEFFREIYLVFLPLAKKMNILFDYDYNTEKYLGYADVRQLEKVVYNLLSNAFRFTPAGKQVKLIVLSDSENGRLEIQVEDEGIGIEKEELPRIFDRFYNSKSSSGIGLFFTKELVTLHKGEITVSNNPKGGATFRVVVPVNRKFYNEAEIDTSPKSPTTVFDLKSIDDIEAIVSTPSPEKTHRRIAGYLETILIVEDNQEMRNYLCSELSSKYKILEADNGEKGVEMAQKYVPGLIVSDVVMPKMDGYELTRILKNDFATSHIPIILLTAKASEEKKITAAESGADDFIAKPFNLNYLLTKIETTIIQRKKLKKRFEKDAASHIISNADKSISETDFINKVQDLVAQNLSKPELNVEFLVEKMGISRTLFFKKMKASTGYAPNEYLRIIRMKEASHLLTSTDKTISEISNAIGFNDPNYFSKTFKKHFGETPSVYKAAKANRNII